MPPGGYASSAAQGDRTSYILRGDRVATRLQGIAFAWPIGGAPRQVGHPGVSDGALFALAIRPLAKARAIAAQGLCLPAPGIVDARFHLFVPIRAVELVHEGCLHGGVALSNGFTASAPSVRVAPASAPAGAPHSYSSAPAARAGCLAWLGSPR